MGHDHRTQLTELWKLVRSVPKGKVASYSDIGRMLGNPATGRMVGRWMHQCPDDGTPWWRIVSKAGTLPIGKKSPGLEMEQAEILKNEGVTFVGDRISPESFWEA